MDGTVGDYSTFSQNGGRLLEHAVVVRLVNETVETVRKRDASPHALLLRRLRDTSPKVASKRRADVRDTARRISRATSRGASRLRMTVVQRVTK